MIGLAKFSVDFDLLHDALHLPREVRIISIEPGPSINTFQLTVASEAFPQDNMQLIQPQVLKHLDQEGHATFTWKFGEIILFRE